MGGNLVATYRELNECLGRDGSYLLKRKWMKNSLSRFDFVLVGDVMKNPLSL